MSHSSIGRKIVTYLTATRTALGQYLITEHIVTDELHATKGWRPLSHRRREQIVKRMPPRRVWLGAFTQAFHWRDRRPARLVTNEYWIVPLKGIRP